jgi:osmotically inducible protein OsmC
MAHWQGPVKSGSGTVKLGSGAFEGAYSFGSRFEEAAGTNPEELIGAAHAGCFSMALSLFLSDAGYTAESIQTVAEVHIDQANGGFTISKIDLGTEAKVPGISDADFQKQANEAKEKCPVSQALAGTKINLKAALIE